MIQLSLVSLVLILTAHLALAVNVPQPESNAAASCFNWSIVPNTANVAATCFLSDGLNTRNTVIELSQCVGNQNGRIGCQVNGGAGASCIFTNIQTFAPPGSTSGFLFIDASCLNNAGQRVTTNSFDLDACLSNINGNLRC